MRKLILVSLLLLTALIAAILTWGYLDFRGSLAELDGERGVAGLENPVRIERDAEGVVTVNADSAEDAAFGLGFVHAQERFFEMDLLRRRSAGELSALVGAAALPVDRQARVHRLRLRLGAALDALPDGQRREVAAYTRGANSGLQALRSTPWPYRLLGQAPLPWAEVDSLLVVAAMAFDLHDSSNRRELALDRMDRLLPADLVELLAADGTQWDAPLWGEPRSAVVLPRPVELSVAAAQSQDPGDARLAAIDAAGSMVGSNSFSVGGSLTSDGRAILANDMHLGLRAPNIWFRARLMYPDASARDGRVDVSGFSLPGGPGIVVGSNGNLAWGFTNSYGDWLDWVRISWVDASEGVYRTADGEERAELFDEVIEVAGGDDETLRVRQTRWGPVVHDASELTAGYALALNWTIAQPGGIDFGLLSLATADRLEDAVAIGQRAGIPPQNLLVVDARGQTAWTIAGRLPQRIGDCDPQRPLDPLAGCGWLSDWLPVERAPALFNPGNDRLWTANSRVADGEMLELIGNGGYDLGARQRQIRDGLAERDSFDERALLAIQLDQRALFLQRWWQLMRRVAQAGGSDALVRLDQASMDWEGEASIDAVSYRLARGFRASVIVAVSDSLFAEGREVAGEDWIEPRLGQIEDLVWALVETRPEGWWDEGVAGWDRLLDDAAELMVAELEVSGPLPERRWGERNTAKICHPLAASIPFIGSRWLCQEDAPLPGDSNMPRVQSPTFGASQRMVVAPGHEHDGIVQSPAGQSGHPLSPFWRSGQTQWVSGEPAPFLPGPAAYRLALVPQAEGE